MLTDNDIVTPMGEIFLSVKESRRVFVIEKAKTETIERIIEWTALYLTLILDFAVLKFNLIFVLIAFSYHYHCLKKVSAKFSYLKVI